MPRGRIKKDPQKGLVVTQAPDLKMSQSEKKVRLQLILADPTDIRTDEEICRDLQIEPTEMSAWKADREFMLPVVAKMQDNLQGSMLIDIIKTIARQSRKGNISASRLGLELARFIETKGSVNINFGGSGKEDEKLRDMSDEDLDRELKTILTSAFPDDLRFVKEEILPVDYEEVEDDYTTLGPRSKA